MAEQLRNYQSVPSGMTFPLDVGPTLPRRAYVLSTPGANAIVMLQGTGVWSVEILMSTDGLNYEVVATRSLPGQWRHDTKGPSCCSLAVRVASFTSGAVNGMLLHGGPVPITNVSPMFGAFLVYSYNATISEPPLGNQIRFNDIALSQVTKAWIRNFTTDGTDQFQALRRIPAGGTMLVQDRDDHTKAVLFSIVGPPVDKIDYVEIPVRFQQSTAGISQSMVLVAVFNPGPVMNLIPSMMGQPITRGSTEVYDG
jgi:hypothetical protein